MTSITRDDVLYLAQLSNITLNEADVDMLRHDVGEILGYVEKLNELDTENVEPTYQVTDLENVWRDDEIDTYGISREVLMKNAPEEMSNQIKVPKVL